MEYKTKKDAEKRLKHLKPEAKARYQIRKVTKYIIEYKG